MVRSPCFLYLNWGNSQNPLFKHHGGSKIFGNRQNDPHPHWCGYSPCQKYLLVPDLGLDKIVIYLVDDKQRSVSHHGYADARAEVYQAHERFSKDGKFIYLPNELNLTIETFSWDSRKEKQQAYTGHPP